MTYEQKATEAIAKAYMFELNKKGTGYICRICLKHLRTNYAGKPINERMIEHYERQHASSK